MADIFLSYSRRDAAVMKRLRDDLRREGFDVWTDETSLEPGTQAWQDVIEAAIESAGCIVVVLSPDAKKSKWVDKETTYASVQGVRVFPVLSRGDERDAVPLSLIDAQWVDIRRNYDGELRKLVNALNKHVGTTGPAVSAPGRNVIRTAEGKLRPAPGYSWVTSDNNDTRVVWSPGKEHSRHPHVVAGEGEGKWSPAPGYAWVSDVDDDLRVAWSPGKEHPKHPHVVANDEEGNWHPAQGYKWASDAKGDFRVVWNPGEKHPQYSHVVASENEGKWRPAPGYGWGPPPDKFRVVWKPGKEHRDHPHVIAGDEEGNWHPASGYTWVSSEAGDLRVKRE